MTNPTQPAEGMPERWQLVPVEPTEEMLLALKNAGHGRERWAALLAAAPKAPPMPGPTDQQLIRLYFRARYPDEGDEAADRFATQGAHWAVNRALEWSRGFLAWLAAQGFTKE